MKTLFLFVDKDLLIRDLLTGDFLPYAASKFKVVVFMQRNSYLRNREFLFVGDNIQYEVWPNYNEKMLNWMKAFRTVFIRQFDYLNVQQFKKKNIPKTNFNRFLLPMASLGKKVFTLSFFKSVEKILLSRKSKNLFKKYKNDYNPAILVTASCGIMNFEAEGLLLAEIFNVPTVAVNFNWDNLTSKVRSLRLPNNLVVWNERIKNIAQKIHNYPPETIVVSGIIRFDPYFNTRDDILPNRIDFLKERRLDPNNKTIVYASTADFIYPFQRELIRLLIELRDQGKFMGKPNIFVRLHYKDPIDKYHEFINCPNVYIEKYKSTTLKKDALNLKATILYGDVHLNYASTVSLDVCTLNRPLVNLAFPEKVVKRFPNQDFPHYKPLIEAGAARLAYNQEGLVEVINEYFENPDLDSGNRKKIQNELVGLTDGLAYKRAVDFLEIISDKSKI